MAHSGLCFRLLGYWGATTRTYHHTAPTNSLYALHEALVILKEEGIEVMPVPFANLLKNPLQ